MEHFRREFVRRGAAVMAGFATPSYPAGMAPLEACSPCLENFLKLHG